MLLLLPLAIRRWLNYHRRSRRPREHIGSSCWLHPSPGFGEASVGISWSRRWARRVPPPMAMRSLEPLRSLPSAFSCGHKVESLTLPSHPPSVDANTIPATPVSSCSTDSMVVRGEETAWRLLLPGRISCEQSVRLSLRYYHLPDSSAMVFSASEGRV